MPLHIWDNDDNNIRVIATDTADGDTATAIRTYTVPLVNAVPNVLVTDAQSLVFDGTHIHLFTYNDTTVRVFLPNTADGQVATLVRTYTVSGISHPRGSAFDGTDIHLFDTDDDIVRVFAPDTANGQTATILGTYSVSGLGDGRGMAFDGTYIHATDYSDDVLRMFLPDTTDGSEISAVRTYTVSGVQHSRGIEIVGTQVHISDNNDDNIRVIDIPPLTGTTARTILRTYTVTGVGNPRGMTLVPNNAPAFAEASYSFTDIAIAVSTVVAAITATDSDNDPLSYSLTGADAGNFAIDTDGEITVTTELSEGTTYNFNVVANDGITTTSVGVMVATVMPTSTDATFTITGPAAIYGGQTVDFTIQSDIDITDFTFDDVVLTGGTFVSIALTATRTWRYRATADAGAGPISLIIREDAVNPGNHAISQTFTRLANPTVTITSSDSDIRVGDTFTVIFQWSSNVTGFANGDITVTGATKVNFASSSASRYVLALRADNTPGDIVVTVAQNAITELNAETEETFTNLAFPTLTMTPADTSIRGGRSTTVAIVFDQDVTNLFLNDFSINAGSYSNLTGSGNTYSITVTAPTTGSGNMILTLREDAIVPGGNAETTATIAYQPLPTVTITSSNPDIQPNAVFTVTFQWSQAVTGFATGDVTVTGATKGAFTAVDGDTYTLALTAASTPGDIVITVGEDTVNEGNDETAITLTSVGRLTPTITPRQAFIRSGQSTVVDVTFTENVTGLALNDFTVDVGTVSNLTGSDDTYEVTVTAPAAGDGAITLTLREDATQPQNHEATTTIQYGEIQIVTVEPTTFESHTVTVSIELAGQDITSYLPARPNLSISRTSDFPDFGVFRSSGIDIPLQNASKMFDTNQASNFFTDNSLPANGRGGRVKVTLTRDTTNVLILTGEVQTVNQTLGSSIVVLVVRDISVRLRRARIRGIGQEVSLALSDYPGYTKNYNMDNYQFNFPSALTPILEGSVSATITVNDVEETIEIVDALRLSGVPSYQRGVVDYANGYLILEGEPPDGNGSVINATWKVDHRFKRVDFIIREIMRQELFADLPQYAIDDIRFERSDAAFGSHGRPYYQDLEITRWLKADTANKKVYMAVGPKLVEYDEASDSYTELATVPVDNTITIQPPGGYGSQLTSETVELPAASDWASGSGQLIQGIVVTQSLIIVAITYVSSGLQCEIHLFDRAGNYIRRLANFNAGSVANARFGGLDTYGDSVYVLYRAGANRRAVIREYEIGDGTLNATTNFQYNGAFVESDDINGIAVTANRIIVADPYSTNECRFYFLDHSFNEVTAEHLELIETNIHIIRDIDADADYIYAILGNSNMGNAVRVYNHSGVRNTDLDFTTNTDSTGVNAISVFGPRMYGIQHQDLTTPTVEVYAISGNLSYTNFLPIQFDTHDFEDFYCLTTNTLRADITRDATFSNNIIQKWDRSANTWTTLLDLATGQPQICHPFDLVDHIAYYADNRKNFQVIEHNNETLIFYRRAQATSASISYYNEDDSTITDVHTTTFTAGNVTGLPYSMDFVLDIGTSAITVYSFVIEYALTGGSISSATLKIYRRTIEPLGTETEIYSESFTDDVNADQYPMSVSGVMLSTDRDKFYFVLDYFYEATDGVGRSELCTIAQDGTGDRTVIKTYFNPLVGARSPVQAGSNYYYLEGGWVRRSQSTDDDEDIGEDEHHYPSEGGRLIRVNADDSVTDLGVVWRTGTIENSPNPEQADIYAGWGLFNAVTSNLIVDDEGVLHFVSGTGLPFRRNNNLPIVQFVDVVNRVDNFAWLQYGTRLPMKLERVALEGSDYWSAVSKLAILNDAEIGVSPRSERVSAYLTANLSVDEWLARSTLFYRDRTILAGSLRTAIASSGTITTIDVNDGTLTEFPSAGGTVIIDKELFSYTGATTQTWGVQLTGVNREASDSTAAAHSIDADVLFIDAIIRDTDATLVSVTSKRLDIANLRNSIVVTGGADEFKKTDDTSITENGEFSLSLDGRLFSDATSDWRDILADRYLARFKEFKDVLSLTVPFNPTLENGQLVVLKVSRSFDADYQAYRVVRVTHSLRDFQSQLIIRGR